MCLFRGTYPCYFTIAQLGIRLLLPLGTVFFVFIGYSASSRASFLVYKFKLVPHAPSKTRELVDFGIDSPRFDLELFIGLVLLFRGVFHHKYFAIIFSIR